MPSYDDLADSIVNFVYRALRRSDAPVARLYMGFWVSVNSLDSNLSKVRFADGTTVDAVPKLSSAGTLVANDPILIARGPGIPLTILGKALGDITVVQ